MQKGPNIYSYMLEDKMCKIILIFLSFIFDLCIGNVLNIQLFQQISVYFLRTEKHWELLKSRHVQMHNF